MMSDLRDRTLKIYLSSIMKLAKSVASSLSIDTTELYCHGEGAQPPREEIMKLEYQAIELRRGDTKYYLAIPAIMIIVTLLISVLKAKRILMMMLYHIVMIVVELWEIE